MLLHDPDGSVACSPTQVESSLDDDSRYAPGIMDYDSSLSAEQHVDSRSKLNILTRNMQNVWRAQLWKTDKMDQELFRGRDMRRGSSRFQALLLTTGTAAWGIAVLGAAP